MVDIKEAGVLAELTGVLMIIRTMNVKLSCLVVQTTPYEIIVERPSMKIVRATIDFDKIVATLRQASRVMKVPLIAEGTHEYALLPDELTADKNSGGDEPETDDERDGTESSSTEEFALTWM